MSEQELYDEIKYLKSIIERKNREIEDLKTQTSKLADSQEHYKFRIKTELEPRIQQERRSYDRWVCDPER